VKTLETVPIQNPKGVSGTVRSINK
jgi:hypothetical protein